MQLLFFFVHALFLEPRNSVASQDLFSNDDDINENSVDGLGFGSLAFKDSGSTAQQVDVLDYESNFAPNTDLWDLGDDSPISFETAGDEVKSTDLIAGSCPSSDKLGARNAETSCPNSDEEKIPIPTLEELLGAVDALYKTLEEKVCFPPRLFHLCCICGGFNGFALCDDCAPCKLAFLYTPSAAWSQLFSGHFSKCLRVWGFLFTGRPANI